MLSCGNNSNRGNTILSSPDVPPLPQCLPLEPITLSNQKYTRSGELRRVLGVSLGSTSEDHTFGVGYLKPPPPVATEELKNFKDSVQDASRKARDRAKMLRESIFKLDKYREAVSSKKRQRNDLLSNERSGGSNLSKLRSQILRNPGSHATQRFEAKSQNTGLGLKKRIRTSMVDADGRSAVVSRQQIVTEKDRDVLKAGSGEDIQIEEKIRRLPVGGEGWEKKMKRKRSVGAVGNRAIDSDRDRKQAMHQKASADTKLRSCDALGFRLSIHEEKPGGSPSTMTKGKVSRAQRTGSIMNVESSTPGHPSSGVLEGWELPATENKVPPLSMTNNCNHLMSTGSSAHPMAQWVGQRPHKISRTRRANLVSPVTKSDEAQILSQDYAASDLSSIYSSHGASKSLLTSCVDNNNPKSKMKLESIPSPIGLSGLSEGEESGGGENKLQGKGADTGRVTVNADHNAGVSMLPSGKNKILVKEETGDGIHSQGRVGRFLSSTNPVVTHTRERVERLRTSKQLQSIRRVSDKNRRF